MMAARSSFIRRAEATGAQHTGDGSGWPVYEALTLSELQAFVDRALAAGCPTDAPILGKTGRQWHVAVEWDAP